MLACDGSMSRKSCFSVSWAISPSAPANSTPVGPAPTTTNVIQALQLLGVGFALGSLERQQNPAAHVRRVLHRLQAGRELLPLVMAKILVRCAGRDDERVVGNFAIAQNHAAA